MYDTAVVMTAPASMPLNTYPAILLPDLCRPVPGNSRDQPALFIGSVNAYEFTNKNMIPFDERSPFNPSGIRIGTPAITTRGMKEQDMKVIGESIAEVLKDVTDEAVIERVKKRIKDLCSDYPLYEGLRA